MPVKLNGSTSGSVTVQAPAVAGTNTLTLPAATGNLLSDQSIVPGSASVPTNGMYLPATNALGFATNSTNAMYIDASQNVGIGTTSPSFTLDARATTGSISATSNTGTNYAKLQCNNSGGSYQFGIDNSAGTNFGSGTAYSRVIWNDSSTAPTIFYTNSTERMRIDSSGGVRIATISNIFNTASSEKLSVKNTVLGCAATFQITDATGGYPILYLSSLDTTNASQSAVNFFRSGSSVGSIGTTASATTYNTSSDYRLKENVAPITTGLATVSALRPVTYDWKIDGSYGEGFIAHELAEVIPQAVTGEKDAVNEDGSIKSQGVDYSKIVVHLVAAIQELSAKNDALEARLVALEAK